MSVALNRAARTARFALAIKGAIGCAIFALTLFGIAVPHLGIEPTIVGEGTAAGVGGMVGALLALKG